MKNKTQGHEHVPMLTARVERVFGYCDSDWHGQPKRVNTWCKDGLLALCKICHRERLFSWAQIDEIRRSFDENESA